MSLIEQIQKLGISEQTQIMQDLHAKYPDSLELTTAYAQLIGWIQNQPWLQCILDRDNDTHCRKAKEIMDEISMKLKETTPLQGIVTANNLLEKYNVDPTSLIAAFQDIHVFMISKVQHFLSKLGLENSSLNEEQDDAMEDDEDNTIDEIKRDLEEANDESLSNEQLSKLVEHSKEQYIILYQAKHSEATFLEQKKKDLQKSGSSKKAEIIKIDEKLKTIQQELNMKGNELTVNERLSLYNKLSAHHKKLQEIQKQIISEIDMWKSNQQKSLSGWPKPQPLDNLQPICEVQTELLCKLYQHILKLDDMFRPALAQDQGELARIDNLKASVKTLLSHFLNKCFVIEKHSPQVLKTNTKFGVTLRHLIGSKLNAHIYPPEVTCTLVSEKYVRSLYQSKGKINPPPNDRNILNNRKNMEYNQKTNTFAVEFKNLSVTRANRQGGKKEESVCEEKRCLQFVSEFNIGGEKFTIMTLSFPTVITVHGNQFADAEATIVWDNAFAAPDRLPFDVPDSVSWEKLAETLNRRWTMSNERELTQENLAYIAGKLFPDTAEDLQSCQVNRAVFNREHLQSRTFTFWKWFFSILDVIKRNMLEEWRDGIIYGFIGKQDAIDALSTHQPGTFLVRFSDSELGGVTIAKVDPSGEIWNLSPWTNQHLGMRKFSDRIKDLESLTNLYPRIQAKDDAFGRYYSEDDKAIQLAPGEYHDTVLATKVIGEQGCATPIASPLHPGPQGHMDFTNAISSIASSPSSSICTGEADCSNIANEEVVITDGINEAAFHMLSSMNDFIAGTDEDTAVFAPGFEMHGPQGFFDDQWSPSFN